MTNDEIEAVKTALLTRIQQQKESRGDQFYLGDADPELNRAFAAIDHLTKRVGEAERERDGCKIMAEGFKDQLTAAQAEVARWREMYAAADKDRGEVYAQLAARDAAIAESLRRADESMWTVASYAVEPLRQIKQPEPKGEAEPAAKPVAMVRVRHGGYGMELAEYVAYALPEGDHWLYAAPACSTQPEPDKLVEVMKQEFPRLADHEHAAKRIREELAARGYVIKRSASDEV